MENDDPENHQGWDGFGTPIPCEQASPDCTGSEYRTRPTQPDPEPRLGGQWKGRIRIAEDFDQWPDAIAAAFEIDPRT